MTVRPDFDVRTSTKYLCSLKNGVSGWAVPVTGSIPVDSTNLTQALDPGNFHTGRLVSACRV